MYIYIYTHIVGYHGMRYGPEDSPQRICAREIFARKWALGTAYLLYRMYYIRHITQCILYVHTVYYILSLSIYIYTYMHIYIYIYISTHTHTYNS